MNQFDHLFMIYGERFNVPWRLLKAQAMQESSMRPDAVSPAGAKGLAQFMPATWAEWSAKLKIENADPCDPVHAIQCQAAYMSWLHQHFEIFDVSVSLSLAAYNWGIGNLKECIATHGLENWRAYLPAETQGYLIKVERYFKEYSR